jgi:hypothetical protein
MSTEFVSPVETTLSQLAEGTLTLADVRGRFWSSTQQLLLALVLPGFPLPKDQSIGDAWRTLDDEQRAVVRRLDPYAATIAERAAIVAGITANNGTPSA